MHKVAGDGFYAEGADTVEIGFDGGLAFEGVLGEERWGDGCGVDEGVVKDVGLAGVLQDLFDVLAGGEAEAFVSLGHQVADVDSGGEGGGKCLGDAADQHVGNQRGVEGAGAQGDEVSVGNGFERFGERGGVGGGEHELDNAAAGGGDAGFSVDDGAVVHEGGDGHVGVGCRVDAAAGGEDLGRHLYGLGEVAGDVGESRYEEIAEGVAAEFALGEAVLE